MESAAEGNGGRRTVTETSALLVRRKQVPFRSATVWFNGAFVLRRSFGVLQHRHHHATLHRWGVDNSSLAQKGIYYLALITQHNLSHIPVTAVTPQSVLLCRFILMYSTPFGMITHAFSKANSYKALSRKEIVKKAAFSICQNFARSHSGSTAHPADTILVDFKVAVLDNTLIAKLESFWRRL